jgi:uncharacterized repeat protein (TIGR02543 family)
MSKGKKILLGLPIRAFALIFALVLGFGACSSPSDDNNETEPVTWTVTFDKNGGDTEAVPQTRTVNSGTVVTAPGTAPTLEDYDFGGWYKEAACENAWNFSVDKITSNVTLYAKWNEGEAVTFYTVTFNANEGAFANGDTEVTARTAAGKKVQKPPVDPTKDGVYFDGWFKGAGGTGVQWNFNDDTVSDNTTLYAKWGTPVTIPATGVTTLTADTWADGDIALAGEQWFKFTATAATQYIHFEPGVLTSVNVQLYDNIGAPIGSQTRLYSGTTSTSRTLTSGSDYYIKATPYLSSYSGAYKIKFSASFTSPDATITTLIADTWTTNGDIALNGEQWFKFTATADTQYIHFEPGALTSVYVQLYDNTGTSVGSRTSLSSSTRFVSHSLSSGSEYYIKVTPLISSYSGAYKIKFNTIFIPPEATITTLIAETLTDGNIASGGEQWFKFTATADTQSINFETGTLSYVYVQLYDITGTTVGSQTSLSSSTLSTSRTVISGSEYYIKVTPLISSYSGAYKIGFSFLPPGTTVTPLTANTWENGDLASGGEQWFKFTATAATQFIHFEPDTLSSVYVQLYNITGTETGNRTRLYNSTPSTSRTITNGNEYYIKVTPYLYSGAYKLAFSALPMSPGTTVTTLTANTWENGSLTSNGEQWFKFTATAATQFIHFEPGALSSAYVQLYDNTGATVGSQTRLPTSTYPSTTYTSLSLTSGNEYYIKVTPYSRSYSGAYRIAFNTSFITPGTTVTTLTANTWVNGDLTAGGEQWYEFTATAVSQYIHLEQGIVNSVEVQLYDNTGASVGSYEYLMGSKLISRTLTSGNIYFIKVTSFSTYSGTYKIGFNTTFVPPGTVVTIPWENLLIDGNLASNSQQWYKFTATASTQYIHFQTGTLISMYVQLYDDTGATVGSQTGLPTLMGALYTSQTLTSGKEYYIKVTPSSISSGTYKIAFNTSTETPTKTVTPLSLNTWANGNIPQGGEQWFKFTATAATQYIHFQTGTLANVDVQLYDNTGTTVGSQTSLMGDPSYASRTVTTGNEYYIKVKPAYITFNGAYKIAFNTSTTAPSP